MEKRQRIILLGFLFLLAAITLLCFRVLPKSEEKKSGEEEERIDLCLWYPWENEGEAYKKSFLEAVEEWCPYLSSGVPTCLQVASLVFIS